MDLSSSDESALSSGNSVLRQIPSEDPKEGGRAICVQDIKAPVGNVWNQILDLDRYCGKVPKLKECKNYLVKPNEDGTRTILTKMVVGVLPGYKYEYYCRHTHHPTQSSLTWSLDYDKYSDFDDVQGHWHVSSLSPSKTRVFYAADLKLRGSVPGPVMNILSKKALKEATSWVKRESEKAFGIEGAVEMGEDGLPAASN